MACRAQRTPRNHVPPVRGSPAAPRGADLLHLLTPRLQDHDAITVTTADALWFPFSRFSVPGRT